MTPLPLTKFLDPADYADPELASAVALLCRVRDNLAAGGRPANIPTEHRLWEYGQALRAAGVATATHPTGPFLDVGSGKSPLMPGLIASYPGGEFFINDTDTNELAYQFAMCGGGARPIAALPESGAFGFISCVSVIEHVRQGHWLAQKVVDLLAPGGVAFFTSDAAAKGPDEYMFAHMRERIYTPRDWQELAGWLMGDRPDGRRFSFAGEQEFVWRGNHVYNYTFASLAIRRDA